MILNPAHLHLLVNHFPIIGGMFSTFILAYAIIKKENSILRLSYILFIICAITSIIASNTGEGAEQYLKSLNKIEDYYLERHVRMANMSNIGMIIIGVISLLALFIEKVKNLKFIPFTILFIALLVIGLMSYTGKLGGEIMHNEIRLNTTEVK